MKIDYSLYSLEYKHTPSTLTVGALLRIAFKDGSVGYSDCHPWPAWGDKSIDQQLALLQQLKPTHLTRCSLEFARLDAEARSKKHSILKNQRIPSSRFLITHLLAMSPRDIDQIINQGHTHVKIKVGNHSSQEVAHLIRLFSFSPLHLVLDFNEKLSQDNFEAFWRAIKPLHEQIEMVEDPFHFDPDKWIEAQKRLTVDFACDRQAAASRFWPEAAAYWVVKPAICSIENFEKIPRHQLIVTTYLDHPVGQLAAAYVASQVDPTGVQMHGLITHHVYQPNAFSESLSKGGPDFTIPEGHGFGYDDVLSNLEWKHLL